MLPQASLYRYYSEDAELLYVGITGQARSRGSDHARDAGWWRLVAYAEFYHGHPGLVSLAERLAIWQERPIFNVTGRVSTDARQSMLAALETVRPTHPRALVGWRAAARVLRMPLDDVDGAVHLGFLESEYPRALAFRFDELERFIGTEDIDYRYLRRRLIAYGFNDWRARPWLVGRPRDIP